MSKRKQDDWPLGWQDEEEDRPPGPADDGEEPYRLTDRDAVTCPGCGLLLEPGTVLCVRCGYHLVKGEKIAKKYEPLNRAWESGPSLKRRWNTFLAVTVGSLLLATPAAVVDGDWPSVLGIWSSFTGFLGFLLGTYDRVNLRRTDQGKVSLTKTWRVFFVERPPERVALAKYQSVTIGTYTQEGVWTWLMFAILLFSGVPAGLFQSFLFLPAGVIPAALWWYCIIHRTVFFVALGQTRASADYKLYRGWDEDRMHEIARVVRDAAQFPGGV